MYLWSPGRVTDNDRALLAEHHARVACQRAEESIEFLEPPNRRHLTVIEPLDHAEQFVIGFTDEVRRGRQRRDHAEWPERAACETGFENNLNRAAPPRLGEIHR